MFAKQDLLAMILRSCCIFAACAVMLVIIMAGCSKSPTEPPPDQGSLLVSRLSVSVVPGGSETITICATGPGGASDTCSVSCSDENIATATISDSTVSITGVGYGTANVTVTSSSGLFRTIPVQVYDPFFLDTGELTVTLVDSFTYIWHDAGSGAPNNVAFYLPVVPEGYHALGSLGVPNWSNPNGNYAMMVVKPDEGSDALAEPTGYELIWWYYRWFPAPIYHVSIWTPIPPAGYVALGSVAIQGIDPPPLDYIVCVREDLTIDGGPGSYVWHDADTRMPRDLGCWRVDQPDAGPHEYAYLTTGTFVGWNYWYPPSYHEVMHILRVDLPMLAEAPYQSFVPRLASFDTPPGETVPMMAKAMLVPCTIVNDIVYSGNIGWQVANSPMYRLERQVYYKLQYHNHNQTSEMQTNSVLIRSGITTTESERIWNETEISVSVEAGLSIKAFSGKVTATVSRRFGYETQTSVAELQEREVSSSINTPPGKAAALWQRFNRYVLYRHNGVDLEPVTSWEFGIDSYVTDEYPDE